MVQLQPEQSETPSLEEAGRMLAGAHLLHSESFLFHKAADPKRTDGVARAMADQEVDLTRAEVNWEIAKRTLDGIAQEFELLRIKLLMGGTDAAQSTQGRDEAGQDEEGVYPF